jgi:hypothetical protein
MINGHSWRSRVAIMRGRYLLGLSNANRQAAGVVTGDEVEVEVEFDPEPRVVAEPADLARALDADPLARAAYNRLPYGLKLQHVRAIESAKKPETRRRRIEKAIAVPRDPGSNPGHPASTETSPNQYCGSGSSRAGSPPTSDRRERAVARLPGHAESPPPTATSTGSSGPTASWSICHRPAITGPPDRSISVILALHAAHRGPMPAPSAQR